MCGALAIFKTSLVCFMWQHYAAIPEKSILNSQAHGKKKSNIVQSASNFRQSEEPYTSRTAAVSDTLSVVRSILSEIERMHEDIKHQTAKISFLEEKLNDLKVCILSTSETDATSSRSDDKSECCDHHHKSSSYSHSTTASSHTKASGEMERSATSYSNPYSTTMPTKISENKRLVTDIEDTKEQRHLFVDSFGTIRKDIWPVYMRNLGNCLAKSEHGKIMVVVTVSKDFAFAYTAQLNAMELYCRLHHYILRIVDPYNIINSSETSISAYVDKYFRRRTYTTRSRPVVWREIFQDAYKEYKCRLKWIVFIDSDVFIVDYERKIEDLIHTVNNNLQRNMNGRLNSLIPAQSFKIIAQDSDQSINGGFIVFSMTDFSYNILTYWCVTMRRWAQRFEWLLDQGWLQHIYLEYAEYVTNKKLPFTCFKSGLDETGYCEKYFTNFQYCLNNRETNSIRNICYSKALAFLGLRPPNSTIGELTINNQSTLPSRSVGEFALVPGITPFDRFNNREFGIYSWDALNWELKWDVGSNCSFSNAFFYHGKVDEVIQGLTKNFICAAKYHNFTDTVERIQNSEMYNMFRNGTDDCSIFASNLRNKVVKTDSPVCVQKIWDQYRDTVNK